MYWRIHEEAAEKEIQGETRQGAIARGNTCAWVYTMKAAERTHTGPVNTGGINSTLALRKEQAH